MKNIKSIGLFHCKSCSTNKTFDNFYKVDNDEVVIFPNCSDCRIKNITLESQKCIKCGDTKLLNNFYKSNKDGTKHKKECMICYLAKMKAKHIPKVRKARKCKSNSLIPTVDLVFTNSEEYKKAYYKKYFQLKKNKAVKIN